MNQDKPIREFDNEELTIDLAELFSVLWSKIYLIILVGLIAALAAFAGTKIFITPEYTSSTSMYMLTRSQSGGTITSSDLQTGTQLTQDYMEMVKSRSVLEQVISVLNLDMSTQELSSSVTTENKTNTRILTISVSNEDPELVQEIANTLRETVSVKIREIMEIDAVNTIEEANLPSAPSSPNVMRNTMLGGILGVLITAGILVIIFLFDDTIKTPDDVEHYLGLNVLTSIPVTEGEEKGKKTKRRTTRRSAKRTRR
ncbi:MAG TPA: protein-tyrosine kinase [Candidatus Mediterraneibacter pullicola]|uniref:Protein-tyrosine kinase n=1 Tax=Candidatus Mediterraneibacter pullicola TaxID=2838682 RepID=A0A9D2KKF2_9FIRM|nr:protein-tyrosine kinase [Candidatus Mediterraneibacter pullicola]